MKACLKMIIFSTVIFPTLLYAENRDMKADVYNKCVDQTIEELGLGNINNAVVEACSHQGKAFYEKEIVKVLDDIKKQSQQDNQQERYTEVLKSQRLWKAYVDQECQNAGRYIGSPMYEFCPMQEYGKRLEQLTEYTR